jgi:DNA-binding MarR family transcriptional regulator
VEAGAGKDELIDGRAGVEAGGGQDELIDGRAGVEAGGGQDELVDALVTMSFATMGVLTRIAAEHELSLTQLRVLAILRDRRVKMTELADYLGLDKSTVSGLVDRAEKRGLLRRVPNPLDGRAVDVLISAAGAELAQAGAAQIARALAPMTSVLSRAEAYRLTRLLQRMLGPAGG